jgi:hypothetical protein
MSWSDENGTFEHKCALAIISLTFAHAKWMTSKPTLAQSIKQKKN